MSAKTAVVQFVAPEGVQDADPVLPEMVLPTELTTEQLQHLLNTLLKNEDILPYSFYIKDTEILSSVADALTQAQVHSTESRLFIRYEPQALFKVRAVSRCSSTMAGHQEAILITAFSPDGYQLATGSGDCTVRLWDMSTETPEYTLKGHTNWIMCIAYSPCGKYIATGSMDATIRLWNRRGEPLGDPLRGHTQCITSLSWEPFHANVDCIRLASASRDGTVRIWDRRQSRTALAVLSHSAAVTSVKWGGMNLLYSSSRDRTIKVWSTMDYKLCRSLEGHAHWVNTLALSTDYALRVGPYNEKGIRPESDSEAHQLAQQKYATARRNEEKLVSGSDDFTLFLWSPETSKKPITRMTGHQQLVNHVAFSPDGRFLASGSFDKSVRLWDALTGKFLCTLRGHVGAVYQVAWSADSRLLLSGSKDSTLKVWDIRKKAVKAELPGHADEIYSVDWSPDGERAASGGKDKMVKIWRT